MLLDIDFQSPSRLHGIKSSVLSIVKHVCGIALRHALYKSTTTILHLCLQWGGPIS